MKLDTDDFVKLGHIVNIRNGCQSRTGVRTDNSSPFRIVQGRDVDDSVRWDKVSSFIPEREIAQHFLNDGDILLPSRGGSDPTAVILQDVPPQTVAAGSFLVLRPRDNRILPAYLAWYLSQPHIKELLRTRFRGTYIAMLSAADVQEIEIPLPPLSLQETIVRVAELQRRERELLKQIQSKRNELVRSICLRAIAGTHS